MNQPASRLRSGTARLLRFAAWLNLVAAGLGCAKGLPSLPSERREPEAGVAMDAGDTGATTAPPMEAATPTGMTDSGGPMNDGAMLADAGGTGGIDAACGTACCNGKLDKSGPTFESDIDCGGPVCRKCEGGEICIANTDCASLVCNATKMCDAATGGTGTGPCAGKTAGMACTDPACAMNTMCDALGNCGVVGDCATMPDSNCTKSTYGGHAYWACDQNANWMDARTKCTAVGLDLVHIGDMAENDFVAQEINDNAGNNAWIGASVVGGAWVWIDDTKAISYAAWNGGSMPAAVANQCGWSDDNGEWDAQICTLTHGYVCEGVVK